jgi:hypothetical protein
LAATSATPVGFAAVAGDAAHALDFVKAPLFDMAKGLTLPPSGSANGDDLQDLLSMYLGQLKAAGGDLVAFGARFDQNLHKPIDKEFGNTSGLNGVHDIHMNQGNPRAGGHDGDNGAFHDGGLLLLFPNRTVGLFLAFQSQEVPTDGNGNPAPNARSLADILGQPGGGTATTGAVYLERALINPLGSDGGHEVVVVGNLTTATLDLGGWQLRDTNARSTALSGTIEPGASMLVDLDGQGVQLGNNGGNLLLIDKAGSQVHAVTYAAADAADEDRFVRFH